MSTQLEDPGIDTDTINIYATVSRYGISAYMNGWFWGDQLVGKLYIV